MKTSVSRRDVLRLAGGAAAGVALSPVPWKLTDDLAIWTQNWSWIPVPPKGEEATRFTACSLCSAGCAVRARCIGGQPVSLHGVAADAVSGGALCALGITGHHLPYHPSRLSSPMRAVGGRNAPRRVPVRLDALLAEAARAFAAAAGESGVAVLDLRPGRAVSWAWRRLLAAVPGASVIAAPGRAGSSFTTLERMADGGRGPIGLTYEGVRTVVSFGAPIADGWGAPGGFSTLLRERHAGLRLIQVEAARSRTAELADRWLPVRPGTEAVLALGLGHVLIAERLLDAEDVRFVRDLPAYAETVRRLTPDAAAAATGIAASEIVALARELAAHKPAVVLAGEDGAGGRLGRDAESAIWALDLLLGSVGGGGALARRRELPTPAPDGALAPARELDEVADGSVAVLIVDASAGDAAFPWPLVERKLVRRSGVVIALAPFLAGTAARADLVVPTAPFTEGLQEVPSAFDAPAATFALAAPLLPARPGTVDPVAFMGALASGGRVPFETGWSTLEDLVKARAAAIHRSGRGRLVGFADGATRRVAEYAGPEAFWAALTKGGRWFDDAAAGAPEPGGSVLGDAGGRLAALAAGGGACALADAGRALSLMPRGERDVTASAAVSPLLAKLYRESSLRRQTGAAYLNPQTARALGVRTGGRARLETASGSTTVRIVTDAGVMPGVVEVGVAPDGVALGDGARPGTPRLLDLCGTAGTAVWRSTAARLVEA